MTGRVDVAVVGGGPAGAAAASVLAADGASTVLLEKSSYDGARIGETLPPDVCLPLQRLGVWDRFRDAGHTPSPGITACWGGPEPYDNDFIRNPYGCGWRVDRNRFDAMLAAAAAEAGATVLTGTVVNRCTRGSDGAWTVAVTRGDERSELAAAFVVDATGRTSSFCRSFGARHLVHDRLVALLGFVDEPAGDERALIEATEEGWWYSARLPDGRRVLAFHTDPAPGLRARWSRHLAAAPETLARAAAVPTGAIGVVSANSHRMEPVAADGWLAVGDAATAHDPLTGLGIHWALESGIAAAEAVVRSSTAAYAHHTEERFDRYLAARAEYYRAEARWPRAPFWQRRHEPTAPGPGPSSTGAGDEGGRSGDGSHRPRRATAPPWGRPW
ncbi:MAG TPA: FAD-dependent monooxygenase [Acidimicrobiales bacterium]|nr:FAD-dependent monooxygenase [Acidimicrobiales bacterium]